MSKGEMEQVKKLRTSSIIGLETKIAKARTHSSPVSKNKWTFLASLMLKRAEQGFTQAQLAARSGLQQSTIARIESGQANPTLENLLKLAAALNCDLVLK